MGHTQMKKVGNPPAATVVLDCELDYSPPQRPTADVLADLHAFDLKYPRRVLRKGEKGTAQLVRESRAGRR